MYKDIFKIRLPREVLADIAEDAEQLSLNLKKTRAGKSSVKRKVTKLQPESD